MQAADPASATRASCKYGSMVLAEPTKGVRGGRGDCRWSRRRHRKQAERDINRGAERPAGETMWRPLPLPWMPTPQERENAMVKKMEKGEGRSDHKNQAAYPSGVEGGGGGGTRCLGGGSKPGGTQYPGSGKEARVDGEY